MEWRGEGACSSVEHEMGAVKVYETAEMRSQRGSEGGMGSLTRNGAPGQVLQEIFAQRKQDRKEPPGRKTPHRGQSLVKAR